MDKSERHPITGCRLDNIYGVQFSGAELRTGIWCMDAASMQSYVDIVEKLSIEDLISMRDAMLKERATDESKAAKAAYEVNEDGVAFLSISGPLTKYPTSMQPLIGGSSYLGIERAMHLMAADDRVKVAVLKFDSPGGTSSGCVECGEAIAELGKKKHTVALADGAMTSAAFLLASQCNEVFASPSSRVGSIGAMTILMDTSGVADTKKVKVIPVVSGSLKAVGAPGVPVTDAHIAYIQELIDDAADLFVGAIQSKRKLSTESMSKVRSEARIYTPTQAFELKLIDGIRSLRDVADYAKSPEAARRGSILGSKKISTHLRSSNMLSADLLAKVKSSIPGASGIADAELETFAANYAVTAASTITERNNKVTELTTKLDDLTKLQTKTSGVDPALAAGHVGLAIATVRHQRDTQLLTPAQCETMEKALTVDNKVDGAPSPTNYIGGRVMIDLQTVTSVLSAGPKNKINSVKSKTQPIVDPNLMDDTDNFAKMADSLLGAMNKRISGKAALPA